MATQYDPIAKDESLNTTESPSRNVADVLAQGLDAIEQAIAGGSGSGGHTIVNASGTDMTQRAKMQFVDAGVTDDSANDKTKVEILQTISSEADLANAPDGVYQGTWDEDPADILTADMVGYGSGTVEDALDEMFVDVTLAVNETIQDGAANSKTFIMGTIPTGYKGIGAYFERDNGQGGNAFELFPYVDNRNVRINVQNLTGSVRAIIGTLHFVFAKF